jgi:Transmembrane amino acid transporter protein
MNPCWLFVLAHALAAFISTKVSFSIAYIVFIAKNLHQLFGLRTDPVVLTCIPVLILLCLLRHLKYLAPFSLVAELVNIVGIAVVFVTDVEFMSIHHAEIEMVHWRG